MASSTELLRAITPVLDRISLGESARGLARSAAALTLRNRSEAELAASLREFLRETLAEFPWCIRIADWTGERYEVGGHAAHWSGLDALEMTLTPEAGHDLLALDVMRFLERFVDGEVQLVGNLYLLPEISQWARLALKPWEIVANRARNLLFQNPAAARSSVKSHYDIAEEALFYLDRSYRSYSCAIFQEPSRIDRSELLRVGSGEHDDFDSLEKAQWRKFAHAADYLAPESHEMVLDVGCGYPGFLMVMMDRHPCRRVVGWTHSANQVREGRKMLAGHDPARHALHEGDYRSDPGLYDHIHSTGMISHVGPPGPESGLVNYTREVRRRIKTGGRYVHHALMTAWTGKPLFDQLGPTFNRRYVWPGFHWYTLGDHVEALEENGFQVVQVLNLTPHYAKTTAAWYERLMSDTERFVQYAGAPTLRAWQVFLAGVTGAYLSRHVHCYRLLCEAVDSSQPSIAGSEPKGHPAARIPIG